MISLTRQDRFRTVLNQRLSWVSCAIESVYHRHNVSAVLRTCDSLGVHNVHLVEGHFKPTKGGARGAERWLNLEWQDSAATAIRRIQEAGYAVWVADIDDNAKTPTTVPINKPICLWMGAELAGVSAEAREAADGVVCIPMHGFSQSLNVSVAAAILISNVTERVRAEIGERALLSEDERDAIWSEWMKREEDAIMGIRARCSLTVPLPRPTP